MIELAGAFVVSPPEACRSRSPFLLTGIQFPAKFVCPDCGEVCTVREFVPVMLSLN